MTPDLPAGSLALFFLLGLRHGLEPDHIAAIDSMTLRALDLRRRHAPWVGALFGLGHGAAVVVVALGVSLLAASFALPPALASVFDWLPVLLLTLLGAWNLRALLSSGEYRPDSLRLKLMPVALRERADAGSALLIGVLFALVVDTLAHVSAWSIFATHHGGWWSGLLAGTLFSAGLLATSAADSQLVCRLLRHHRGDRAARRVRRGIGWFVVLLSFAAALSTLAELLEWGALPDADWLAWAATGSVVVLSALSALSAWTWARRHKGAPMR